MSAPLLSEGRGPPLDCRVILTLAHEPFHPMSRLGPRVRRDTRAGRLGTGMSREEGVKNETEHRLRVASSLTVLGHFKKTGSSFVSQLESNVPTLKQLHCVIPRVCVRECVSEYS